MGGASTHAQINAQKMGDPKVIAMAAAAGSGESWKKGEKKSNLSFAHSSALIAISLH